MADYICSSILVFIEELLGTREGNLIDVFVDIFGSHTDAAVAHGESSGFLIDCHTDIESAELTLKFAERRQCADFLSSIHCVRHQFTKENLVVAVKKFLDDRKYILGRYSNCSFLHICCYLFNCHYTNNNCKYNANCKNCHSDII